MYRIRALSAFLALMVICTACSIDVDSRERGIQSNSDRSFFDSGKTVVRGPEGQKIKLHRPSNMKLRRGEAETLTVRFDRENFSEPVQVTVSQLPSGVEAVDAPRTTELERIEIVLRADPDADLVANQQVVVTVAGPDNISASETFDLSVRDRS